MNTKAALTTSTTLWKREARDTSQPACNPQQHYTCPTRRHTHSYARTNGQQQAGGEGEHDAAAVCEADDARDDTRDETDDSNDAHDCVLDRG